MWSEMEDAVALRVILFWLMKFIDQCESITSKFWISSLKYWFCPRNDSVFLHECQEICNQREECADSVVDKEKLFFFFLIEIVRCPKAISFNEHYHFQIPLSLKSNLVCHQVPFREPPSDCILSLSIILVLFFHKQ